MNGSAFDQRPKTQDLKVWEVSDNLTWVKGRHIVKFGGKFRHGSRSSPTASSTPGSGASTAR